MEWLKGVKHGTLRCFEHLLCMNADDFVKRMNKTRVKGEGVREGSSVKWIYTLGEL